MSSRRRSSYRCIICGRSAEADNKLCLTDEISFFIIDDMIEKYEESERGVVMPVISAAMADLACLHLNDHFISNLKRLGDFFIQKLVVNYGVQDYDRQDFLDYYDVEFQDTSYFTVSQALDLFEEAQIVITEGDVIHPGKLLQKLIDQRRSGFSLKSESFKSSLDEFWGLFSLVATRRLVYKRLNGEINRFPRTALGILNIIGELIRPAIEDPDMENPSFQTIHRLEVASALAKVSNTTRGPLIARLIGLSIDRRNHVFEDVDDESGQYTVTTDIANLAEYYYDLFRSRDVDLERTTF